MIFLGEREFAWKKTTRKLFFVSKKERFFMLFKIFLGDWWVGVGMISCLGNHFFLSGCRCQPLIQTATRLTAICQWMHLGLRFGGCNEKFTEICHQVGYNKGYPEGYFGNLFIENYE